MISGNFQTLFQKLFTISK